jgi:hypothetical protein
MKTKLDEELEQILQHLPQWDQLLDPNEVDLVKRRLHGATFEELAAEAQLTRAGVRLRLYGTGHGRRRSGGILGRLRALTRFRSQEKQQL